MTRSDDPEGSKGGGKRKRRSYGDGSVWELPNGKWQGAYFLGRVNGKQKRAYVTGDTRREVMEKLQELAVKYRAGDLLATAEKHTLETYLLLWLEQVVKPQTSPSTYRSRRDNIKLHVTPHLGSTRLDKVTPQQVQALLNNLAEEFDRVPGLVRAMLHTAFEQAIAWGLLVKNPVKGTKNPRTKRRDIEPLSQEEAERFLEAVSGHRLEALFRTTLGMGLRRGEVLSLLWADVDLKKATLRIRDGKTAKSSTTMPIPATIVEALQDHWVLQQQERRVPDWEEHGYVFPSSRGTQLGTTTLFRTYKAALVQANLPTTTRFHDLRHSFATILLAMGEDIRTIMEVMRHTNIKMTSRYAHVLDLGKRAAVSRMDEVVGKKKKPADEKRQGEGS